MKSYKKTLRRRKQRSQRSRKHKHRSNHRRSTRHLRKHRGGSLPVPAGSLVAVSTQGEYGMPVLISKQQFEKEQERGGLEA